MHSSWKSGGGPWVFWQILLRGVLGVVRKSVGGGVVLLHFYVEVFKNLYRGYMRCPPLLPPVCIYVWNIFWPSDVTKSYYSIFVFGRNNKIKKPKFFLPNKKYPAFRPSLL
jgi:hypothetical protein